MILPVFGFRLELGTSMPSETREYLSKPENLYLSDTDRDVRYYRDYFVGKGMGYHSINFYLKYSFSLLQQIM